MNKLISKISIRLMPMLAVCILASSCEKYLDIKKSNIQSPITTVEECLLILDDYGKMNFNYPSDGMLSADDYYVTDADLQSVQNNDGSLEDKNLYTWQSFAQRAVAQPQWQGPYNIIYTANVVREMAEKFKDRGEAGAAKVDVVRGTSLFFRAFCFWQIAQLYAKPYSSTAAQDPGIPLRLEADVSAKVGRGTVEQTYQQIIKDLKESLNLLPPSSVVPTRPNKAAAYGMLARVYNSMGNYQDALTNATAALDLNHSLIDFNLLDKTAGAPFVRYNPEMIFHAVATGSDFLNPDPNASIHARINEELVNSYVENDLRKDILLKPNGDGSYGFSGNYEPEGGNRMFVGIAVDELYLIRAESYARTGNFSSAMNDLNALLVARWNNNGGTTPYIIKTAATETEALSMILAERRKELVMRGLRWTDLRRLNQDTRFAVTLTRLVDGQTNTLPPNDLRYTLLIPREVIQEGKHAQNPR